MPISTSAKMTWTRFINWREMQAYRRKMGEILCADIMSRDLVTAEYRHRAGGRLGAVALLTRSRRCGGRRDRARRVIGIPHPGGFPEARRSSRPTPLFRKKLVKFIRRHRRHDQRQAGSGGPDHGGAGVPPRATMRTSSNWCPAVRKRLAPHSIVNAGKPAGRHGHAIGFDCRPVMQAACSLKPAWRETEKTPRPASTSPPTDNPASTSRADTTARTARTPAGVITSCRIFELTHRHHLMPDAVAGTWNIYSKKAMPQLTSAATSQVLSDRLRKCAYQAKVMKILLHTSKPAVMR